MSDPKAPPWGDPRLDLTMDPSRLERLDRLSRQLRIDQTARAIYVQCVSATTTLEDDGNAASWAFDSAEILEAERERRRKKDTETS